jgi:HD-GYP domain-containing protein (c-di-GMP phosphodiesterase class II)/CHASE3 domain sensor protein
MGWWLAVGTAALVMCVAAAFVALLSSVTSLQGASVAQQATGQELTVANVAQNDVLAMDAALRSFALTRESRFVASYNAARERFSRDATALAAAERRDDGIEDPSTYVLTRAILDYEHSYAQPLIQLTEKRLMSRRELKGEIDLGAVRLQAIRIQLTKQTATSSGDARQRQSNAQAAAAATRSYAIFGLVTLGFLIAGFALAMRRGIALPLMRLRGRAERLARGDRGLRMPRSRLRELDDLGSSFDSMADAVTEGREKLQEQNRTLEERVRARTSDLEAARVEILTRLASAAEYRDDATHQHTERVAKTTRLLALTLKLSRDQADLLALAAPLHDIGKIGIPDAVLLKPGKLTDDEFAVMKTHAQVGANMLAGSGSPVLQAAAQIAQHHHERWDGTGYPHRLRGTRIPLAARIVAVADTLDALTHERPYKAAWSLHDALHEIFSQSARQFDPRVIDALHQLDHGQLLPTQQTVQLENEELARRS